MSVALYVVGFMVLIGGLAMAANLLGISQTWIVVGVIVLIGIAIISIASNIERHEPPHTH